MRTVLIKVMRTVLIKCKNCDHMKGNANQLTPSKVSDFVFLLDTTQPS